MSRRDFSQIQQFYRPTDAGEYNPQSNPVGDFLGGFKQGQEIVDRREITRQRQLQNQQILAEEERKVRIDTLSDLSAKGDYNALDTLMGLDAARAKPIVERQYQKISRIGQLAEGVNRAPQSFKAKQYQNTLKQAELEGLDVSGMPKDWSDEAQQFIDFQINTSKTSKEFLDEKKYQLDASLNKARIDTERAQQAKYYADANRLKNTGSEGNIDSKAQDKLDGQARVRELGNKMRNLYLELDKSGAILNPEKGPLDNLMARFQSGEYSGQIAGKAFGTKEQSNRREIKNLREQAKLAIIAATGMGVKAFDSNQEAQSLLKSLGDPSEDLQSNLSAIDSFVKNYGGESNQDLDPNEGKIAINPQTGEKIIRRGGQWQKI